MVTKKKTISAAAPAASPATPTDAAALYRADHQKDVINRLRRIEGQMRGLVEMIESGRACEDIAVQMSAARRAMDRAFYRMMACSLMEAVCDADGQDKALAEVEKSVRMLEKFS